LKDFYKILGVSRTSSQDEIRNAYRGLAKKHHPDSNPNDPNAEERFKQINEAYTALYDDEKRAEYDRKAFGEAGHQYGGTPGADEATGNTRGQSNINYQDFARTGAIFEDFFSFNPKTKEHTLNRKDENIKPVKTKDAFDAIFNKKKP